MKYPLIGKKQVTIGSEVFDPELVNSEVGSITLTPSTTEVSSNAATINVPNGAYEEASAVLQIIIPSVEVLGRVFPEFYKKATGTGMEGGQVTFGAGECLSTEPIPVVIHNACEKTSENDIYLPAAIPQAGGEFTISLTDPFVLELNLTLTKDEKGDAGYVRFGHGMLDKQSMFDPETGTYKPVTQ